VYEEKASGNKRSRKEKRKAGAGSRERLHYEEVTPAFWKKTPASKVRGEDREKTLGEECIEIEVRKKRGGGRCGNHARDEERGIHSIRVNSNRIAKGKGGGHRTKGLRR